MTQDDLTIADPKMKAEGVDVFDRATNFTPFRAKV